jgi:hypothetical protein
MNNTKLFEWKGIAIAIVALICTFFLFLNYTSQFFYSFFGSVVTAILVWCAYIVLRMLFLAWKE